MDRAPGEAASLSFLLTPSEGRCVQCPRVKKSTQSRGSVLRAAPAADTSILHLARFLHKQLKCV